MNGSPGPGANSPDDPLAGDPLDDLLSLAEAARLGGLSPHTLTQQAERGKLRARKIGHVWITTRRWLDDYLAEHARGRATPAHTRLATTAREQPVSINRQTAGPGPGG